MKKRRKILDYTKYTNIEIWQFVKAGFISRFPTNFWTKESFKEIFRYICIEQYNFKREDICNIQLKQFLTKNYIIGGLKCFQQRTFEALNYCFPEYNLNEWEITMTPKDYWNDTTIKKAISWLCEKENIIKREDVINKFSTDLIKNNKLATLCIRYDMQYLLSLCFPEYDIKVWEMRKVGHWTEEMAHEAIKWFLQKENLTTREEICRRFSGHLLEKNGLGGMLKKMFKFNTIDVLEFEFPGEYKKEDLKAYRNHLNKEGL